MADFIKKIERHSRRRRQMDDAPVSAEAPATDLVERVVDAMLRARVSGGGVEHEAIAAIAIALEEAAKAVEGRMYLLGIGDPSENPFTRDSRVCQETTEQAAAAIRAMMEKNDE